MIRKTYASRMAACLALAAMAVPACAQSRFDIAGSELIDHTTGLVWQSLSKTAGMPLPETPQLQDARVASLNEVFALLPLTAGNTHSVSTDSDLYTALSFFMSTSPRNTSLCTDAPQGASCFGAWAAEATTPASYDIGVFWVAAVAGQSAQVNYFSTASMGNYSQSFCSFECNAGQFTVRAIPEPSRSGLLLTGLLLAFLSKGLARRKHGRVVSRSEGRGLSE